MAFMLLIWGFAHIKGITPLAVLSGLAMMLGGFIMLQNNVNGLISFLVIVISGILTIVTTVDEG